MGRVHRVGINARVLRSVLVGYHHPSAEILQIKELQYNNSMTTDNINYAYITGAYEGMLQTLAYTLTSKGIVAPDKYEELKSYLDTKCARIKQVEREYTNPKQLSATS